LQPRPPLPSPARRRAILALGAWIAARLDFATSLPFPLVLLATGVLTAVLGVLVGLVALALGTR